MKKFIIAALVLLLVCSTAVFARYGEDPEVDIEDYTGFTLGGSYVYETYKAGTGTEVDKAAQLYLGISEYAFFGKGSSLGLYVDAGILFNLKDSYRIDGVSIPADVSKSPLYIDVTMGLGGRFRLDSAMDLLFAVGPEFTYFTTEYTFRDAMDELHTVEKTYWSLGAALDAEIAYRLGRDFYISIGGKASLLVLKWMSREETTWAGYVSDDSYGTDEYFGYRLTPKVSFYYQF